MVDRKGFIKIVEASIAILLIFAVIIILVGRNNIKKTEDLSKDIPAILEEIAVNNNLRKEVLNYDIDKSKSDPANRAVITNIEDFVKTRVRPGINYTVEICKTDDECTIGETYPQSRDGVYAGERIISSEPGRSKISPRKVKIFLWKNP